MMMTSLSDQPLSEQFRIVARNWVDAEAAACLMEETKSAVFAEMVARALGEDISLAHNRAETLVKSSPSWKEYVTEMVRLRRDANLAKVKLEYVKMKASEQMSAEATHRAEARL